LAAATIYPEIARAHTDVEAARTEAAKTNRRVLEKGVPALAVLEPDDRLVFAQKQGEFEAMRRMACRTRARRPTASAS